MVEFVDGSVLAQMGFPTMEIPILYALAYPERLPYRCRRFDPVRGRGADLRAGARGELPRLLARRGGRAGGRDARRPSYNAANEVAVAAFLAGRIGFPEIPAAIEHALDALGRRHGRLASRRCWTPTRWARRATQPFIEDHALC